MPRSVDKCSSMDESVLRKNGSSSMQTDESFSNESPDPSTSNAMDQQSTQTPSTDRPRTIDGSPPSQSPSGSLEDFAGSTQQSSPKHATRDRATSAESQTTQSIARSHSKQSSSSVEDVNQSETEMPQVAHSRGRGRRRKGGGGRRGKGRHTSSANFTNLNDETGLLNNVINDPTSLTDIVNQWIEMYKVNRDKAVRTLTQFFVSSCGSNLCITLEMQASLDHKGIIRLMTENGTEESADYPLIASGRWKKFREIYAEFVSMLIRCCRHSIIYDQYLMDKVIELLTCLTDSEIRSFRHTATFAVMKLATALVDVAVTVSKNLDGARRQYEAEKRKMRENRSTTRLENLSTKRDELEENMQELREMLDYIFTSVFAVRYIDVVTDIRALCFAEIAQWIQKLPELFLDDRHLKYIGQSLYDEAGEVRLKCVEMLQPLYDSEDLVPTLELFVGAFKDRIVAMSLDRDFDVAAQAVKLVTCILKHHPDILTDNDREKIYELVYSADRDVAHAAGEFVNEILFTVDENAAIVTTKRGKPRLPNTPVIRDLVAFFIEAELPDHAEFLVDSLIETNTMTKDWECMTDLLLEDAGRDEEALTDQQETSLIEIMVCCVKQAATGEPPLGREPARKNVSAKRQAQMEDDKRRLTVHFIPKLPLLFEKYGANPEKIVHLLALPQYFDLRIYVKSRQMDKLDAVLQNIYRIVEISHDTDVLETSAKTLELMCTEIFEHCDNARSIVLDRIVERYREINEQYLALANETLTPEDDETIEFVHSLRKVAVYYGMHDMNSYEIWDSLWKNLEGVRFSPGKLPVEAATYCIRACYFSILWSQNRLIKAGDSGSQAMRETPLVTERLHSFVELMTYFVGGDANISSVPSLMIIREEAYNSICDFLIFFNYTMWNHENPVLHQLAYEPDENVRTILNRFVQENVFCEEPDDDLDDNSKIEQLHKRRNFLAGYCKLVISNTIAVATAADIFKNYVKYYDNYGDILKATISRARDNNRTNWARTMLRSLTISYDEMVQSRDGAIRNSEEFTGIKGLAKKFALLFGFDAVKNSEALLALHGDGVNFAVTPPDDVESDPSRPPRNLSFLEILLEFSKKLSVDDRVAVLDFVEKRFEGRLPLPRSRDWKPLHLYIDSLRNRAGDQVSWTGDSPGEEEIVAADKESVNGSVTKSKRKRGPRKSKLPVTKVANPPRAGTSALSSSHDTVTAPHSQMSAIEDPSQDVHGESASRLESLQIDSQRLPVTKVTNPRGPGTSALSNSHGTVTAPHSPMSAIEDPSQDVHGESASRLESFQIDSQRFRLPTESFTMALNTTSPELVFS